MQSDWLKADDRFLNSLAMPTSSGRFVYFIFAYTAATLDSSGCFNHGCYHAVVFVSCVPGMFRPNQCAGRLALPRVTVLVLIHTRLFDYYYYVTLVVVVVLLQGRLSPAWHRFRLA